MQPHGLPRPHGVLINWGSREGSPQLRHARAGPGCALTQVSAAPRCCSLWEVVVSLWMSVPGGTGCPHDAVSVIHPCPEPSVLYFEELPCGKVCPSTAASSLGRSLHIPVSLPPWWAGAGNQLGILGGDLGRGRSARGAWGGRVCVGFGAQGELRLDSFVPWGEGV